MKNKSRFAPSPSGLLHVGNARSAVLNWAYIENLGGDFILRIDDTDKERSKKDYEIKIKEDLKWLGIEWKKTFNQSDNDKIYSQKIEYLKKNGKIYPCFETPDELSLKKKSQLSSGRPPIYDRSSLKLSKNEIENFIKSGIKPHWRLRLEEKKIEWEDIIKGKVIFDSKNLSDPILIREDGTLLYHLPSVIDDINEEITHIIRGEDHITNTAYHIQLFEAFNVPIPKFGHHPFLIDNEGKGFAKRLNSLSIRKIKEEGYENLTLLNYLLSIGTSKNLSKEININELIKSFDINTISSSPPKFSLDVLKSLNKEIIQNYNFEDVRKKFLNLGTDNIQLNFWEFVKYNINFFSESLEWLEIINDTSSYKNENDNFLKEAAMLLPEHPYDLNTWESWTNLISQKTGKKGKELFMPLRKALTGKDKGPELKYLLPLLSKETILKKLGINS